MQANPSDAEAVLDQGWITEELFETWQQQAALACEILNLRGVDALAHERLVEELLMRGQARFCFAVRQEAVALMNRVEGANLHRRERGGASLNGRAFVLRIIISFKLY